MRLVDELQPPVGGVTHQLVGGRPGSTGEAAAALDEFDVAIVQHEYGIYGGREGRDVIDVLDVVRAPVVAVLHTVLTNPTAHQHSVLQQVVDRSAAVVTMTRTARDRLVEGWDVDPRSVHVVAHGAVDNRGAATTLRPGARPIVLTWGLLGEGKGIEWAIPAMATLSDLVPQPRYRVVGQTHPRVVEREGETYRNRLETLVSSTGAGPLVEFDARYLSGTALREVVRSADVVLLPYDSREQVTSGVLTEAVVAGKPVVSTAFPHAVELLVRRCGHPGAAARPRRHRRRPALGADRARACGVPDGGAPPAQLSASSCCGRPSPSSTCSSAGSRSLR